MAFSICLNSAEYFIVVKQPLHLQGANTVLSQSSTTLPSGSGNILTMDGVTSFKIHRSSSEPTVQTYLQAVSQTASNTAVEEVKGNEFSYLVTVENDKVDAFLEKVKSLDSYVHVQPNYWYKTQVDPTTEPLYSVHKSTDFNTMNIGDSWEVSTGQGVKVAVLDTGLKITHEEFCPAATVVTNTQFVDLNGCTKVVSPKDFVTGIPQGCNPIIGVDYTQEDNLPHDDQGHGTHVSGIVAASKNNKGIIGMAYDAQIMPVRVLAKCVIKSSGDETGAGSTEWVVNGIDYAVSMGADIINLSLGGISNDISSDLIFQQTITNAINAGVIVVAAAGNDKMNIDTVSYPPATFPGVITVSSVGKSGDFTSYSNFGERINVAAVGGEVGDCVTSSIHSSDSAYGNLCGTSMAAPYVAGYAALLRSYYAQQKSVKLLPSEAMRLIQMSASLSPNQSIELGYGIIDVEKGLYLSGANIAYNSGSSQQNQNNFYSTDSENRFLCYPNPFHRSQASSTSCEFYFTKPANVDFSIYSRRGRRVKHEQFVFNSKTITWDGRDASGHLVPKGVYQAILRVHPTDGSTSIVRKHLITVL